jgi:hypothetical protein
MKKGASGQARIHISAPPEKLYDLVSDVTRMGQWSPETVKCEWLDEATGPVVGARFKGTNRRGILRWSTKPKVVAADRPREFSFATPDTRWTYRFESATDGGSEASESFEMLKDVPWYVTVSERYLMRVADRKADLEAAMQQTLERIKAAAEATG